MDTVDPRGCVGVGAVRRGTKATRDTLPGARHGGAGDASNISEQQLVEKLSGIINQRSQQ